MAAGNAQDPTVINLPVDSQTLYTRIARKTIVDGAADMQDDMLIPRPLPQGRGPDHDAVCPLPGALKCVRTGAERVPGPGAGRDVTYRAGGQKTEGEAAAGRREGTAGNSRHGHRKL